MLISSVWMAGYGGFSISINPFFSPAILTWMQKYGVILAVANIRGGGEFGEEWEEAVRTFERAWQASGGNREVRSDPPPAIPRH